MWQRIQTLYLGLATLLIASLFWCDVADIIQADNAVEHIKYTGRTIYLVWIIILTVLQVFAVGGYKWRMRQFRMVIVAAIMCLGFQGWLVYDYVKLHDELVFSFTILFPFAAAVLDFLAAHAILVDEALVRSANRLRLPRQKKHKQ